jgi:DNA-binding response OmpR family regulator
MYVTEKRGSFSYRNDVLPARTQILVAGIVEREFAFGRFALDQLEHNGFAVRIFSIEIDVIRRLEQLRPSLVVIGMTTPRGRALELCRGIRCVQSMVGTPVIFLAASASEEDRVLGLESGADDYISKSSSAREVVARVRAVMRRVAREQLHSGAPHIAPPFIDSFLGTHCPTVRMGDIEIDPTAMRISIQGSDVVTTNLEFRLLFYLAHNQTRVFTREQLLDAVWHAQHVELRSVDACVRRLRRKIEPDPLRPTYLRTIRGAGYCLQPAAA